jgi:Tol biopolymer transport system component
MPFDSATGAVTGPAARAVDGVITAPATGVGAFDLAGGTLAYFAGWPGLFDTEVVRVDRAGRATPLAVPARATTSVRALPAGRLLLRTDGANATLWLYDLPREIDTRLTWAWDADHAVLAPGGEHVYMVVTRGARAEIVRRRADGTGEDEPVWRGDAAPANLELSRDGRVLVFDAIDPATATADVMVLRFDTPGAPAAPYQATPEHETRPALSPDGRWLAYTSSTSGRDEIYVQAFPTPGPRVQLSAHGGRWARWRDDGRAVVFRAGREVLEVEVTPVDGRLEPSPARRWFELDDVDDPARRTFDLIDGVAGLVTVRRAPGWRPADALRVVVGWRPAP